HHMAGSWDRSEIHPVKPEWIEGYDRAGIDFRGLKSEPVTWWDRDIAQILGEHGPDRFRKVAIWDKDWNNVANSIGLNGVSLADPGSVWEKAAHQLLTKTQARRDSFGARALEKLLRMSGW